MGLHDAALGRVERARLVQDLVGDPDLAEVVQVGAAGDDPEAVGRQAHAGSQLDRDLGRALAVAVGVGVLHLHGLDEGPQRLGVAVDDVLERVVGERPRQHVGGGPPLPAPSHDGVDGAAEPGQQVAVVVPPRHVAELAELERRHRGDRAGGREHDGELDHVTTEVPPAPVRPDDGEEEHHDRDREDPEHGLLVREGGIAAEAQWVDDHGGDERGGRDDAEGQREDGVARHPAVRLSPGRPAGQEQAGGDGRHRRVRQTADPAVGRLVRARRG